MSKRNVFRMFAALVVGGGLAFAVPALPAVGQVSPPAVFSVEVGDEATLVARGAAVSVPVEVTCFPGSNAFLSVRVTQRTGSRIASGFGDAQFTCTGEPQTVDVLVHAQGQAFKKGPAVVQATLSSCGFFPPCETATDTETVQIVR
jgi:hypothetical protein